MATVTAMQLGSKRMLGEILMELGLIDRAQLRLGLVHHHEARVPLGKALVREGLCTEADILRALLIIETFATRFGARDLQQVPSEVIDTGIFRYVPYLTYETARGELNIYGDPQHPAGVEIGIYAGKARTKEELRSLMAGLLQQAADRELVHGLSLDEDKLERAGLTFEVTPPTAEGSFGGWWISIYDEAAINKARASDAELKTIAVEAPAEKNESPAEPKKPARKSKEPSTSDRVYIQDYTREDGAYVRPPL